MTSEENGGVVTFTLGPLVMVQVWPAAHYLQTLFRDGTTVAAAPEDTNEYRATAERLGYGTDTWRMCLEHEMAHHIVSALNGRAVSPTLWAVAHGTEELHREVIAAEEGEVLEFQRLLNLCRSAS